MISLLEGLLCFNLTFRFFLAGILFTMLVFGPACGFILGSFCTKIYVDAVFIDTSKEYKIRIAKRPCNHPRSHQGVVSLQGSNTPHTLSNILVLVSFLLL